MLLTFRRVLRDLQQQRGYSTAVIVTLALTIGTTTAIFSAVYAILLKPLPITRPDALVICWERAPERNLAVVELSYRAFEELSLSKSPSEHGCGRIVADLAPGQHGRVCALTTAPVP